MANKKLKILIINYEFPPLGGGGGVATNDLALEWVKQGTVDVLTSSFTGLPAFEKVGDINVHRVKILFRKSRDAASFISMLSYLPGAFFRGIRLIRKNRYDVINTHFAVPSGPVGFLLGKMFGIPNVLSLHGGDIYDPSKKMSPHKSFFFSRVVRFILNHADRIVAQSSNTRDNTLKYYNPRKPVEIIPLAFHAPADPKTTRKAMGIDAKEFMLITIGRLIKRKALEVLIKAVARVKDKKVRLYVMGDGPEREFLEQTARESGVADRIVFLGYVSDEDKFRYIRVADLFTLTSLHEGFGIVFMESMYFGLPVVCTNNGGQVDFLKDGENALLIDVGDVGACAAAIERFVRDRKLYTRCSKNNREAVKMFYAEAVANKYIEIFRDIIV
jgi:L-malate glycosyltransferase